MDYSSFMASGLEAIAPRHTTHRRARSATTMNIRPLPPLPPLRPHWKGHSRATSVPFRVQDLQQGTGGVAGPSSQGSNGNGGRGARIEESQNAEGGDKGSRHTHAVDFDDASSSYLSMDDDSDSDILPDELEDDIHATFIDLNESSSSLLMPQLALPDSPHERPESVKASRTSASLSSFLSFTPGVSPVDSPILALPSQHFLKLPEPALSEGTSKHLDTKENQFDKNLSVGAAGSETRNNWRDAVDSLIGEEKDNATGTSAS